MTDPDKAIKEAAFHYLKQGYAVVPGFSMSMMMTAEQRKRFSRSKFWFDQLLYTLAVRISKSPIRWFSQFFPLKTEAEIHHWFDRFPQANVMLPLGRSTNQVMLDVDYYRPLSRRVSKLNLPPTRKVKSGGGMHYYFRYDGDIPVTRRYIQGSFLHGDTCLAMVPPSMHYSGKPYRWVDEDMPFAPLPDVLKQAPKAVVSHVFFIHGWRIFKYMFYHYVAAPFIRYYAARRFP